MNRRRCRASATPSADEFTNVAEALVQVLPELADLARVLGDRGLAPAVCDDLEQRHQRRRRRDDDALLERVVDEVGTLGQRGRQELVARQEQHREFRAVLELLPVTLLAELAHALLHLLRVAAERDAARLVVLRFDRVQVGVERRLRVDHELRDSGMRTRRSGRSAPASPLDDRVCSMKSQCSDMPDSSTTRRNVISPQRPRTSGRRSAVDRLRVSRCRRSCTFTRLSIWPESLAGGFAAFALDALRLFFLFAQRVLDGLHQLRDGVFAFLERGLRRGLVAAEDLARELEESFAVGIERHARGALDGGAHLRLALRAAIRQCARAARSPTTSLARAPRARRAALRRAARRAACRAGSR